ncbi:MAG: metal ABC transporter substrate-binding protein [Gammaproteobacteria bacterium]|jgi:zinc/manganese transport system substrate-binding protein|nr:metal ABC transporter substrate-binding protein [Gammaproteobacteria bacterium]
MRVGRIVAFLTLTLALGAAAAAPKVVATTAAMGMLAREVGGPAVEVTVLAPPDRDAHYLDARPSFIRALRAADLVMAVGADLEAGWLPPALSSAANPGVLPGRDGYFEAAAQVDLLETGGAADRSLGDVHPAGNPHLNLDPVRMATVARALADRLGRLDPAGAAGYRQRADDFARAVEARMPDWQARGRGAPGAVLYHKDGLYLLDRLGLPALGFVEPLPGVPPSAGHIKSLTERLQGKRGVILYTVYQPAQAPEALAATLGWPTARLPLDPPLDADTQAYLGLIDRWVSALAGAKGR